MAKVSSKMIMVIMVIARLKYLAVRGKMQQTKLLAQPCRGLIRPSPFQFVNDYIADDEKMISSVKVDLIDNVSLVAELRGNTGAIGKGCRSHNHTDSS